MSMIADLPAGEHKLLVKLSGGADSSIVYYALCDKFKDRDDVKIICITLDTDLKNNYIKSAKRIIEVVADLTGKRPYKHYTTTVPHSDENYINGQDELVKSVYTKYQITHQYSGITINPPVEELKRFVMDNYEKFNFLDEHGNSIESVPTLMHSIDTRDKERDTKIPTPYDTAKDEPMDESGYLFAGGDKKTVKELYDKYDMMEKLYPHTFSCESAPYFTDDKEEPIHCGYCFFCLERWYGFGRLV